MAQDLWGNIFETRHPFMNDYYRSPPRRGGMGGLGLPSLASSAKILIGINVGIWLLAEIAVQISPGPVLSIYDALMLSLDKVLSGYIFQVFTYMFLHDLRSAMHILMNMLVVYFFASPLEARWGPRGVIRFALLCGLGGGVAVLVFQAVGVALGTTSATIPTLGFSGAVLGLLAAFCLLHNEASVLLRFIILVNPKYDLPFTLVLDFVLWLRSSASYSFPTHLGGALTGIVLVLGLWRPYRLKREWYRFKTRRELKRRRDEDVIQGPWLN